MIVDNILREYEKFAENKIKITASINYVTVSW